MLSAPADGINATPVIAAASAATTPAALAEGGTVASAGPDEVEDAAEFVEAGGAGEDDLPLPPGDAEESAFLGEARERGEVVRAVPVEVIEEVEDRSKALPALNELVNRIPSDVREVLEELFRARFVAVRRVPKKALKT